MPGPNHHVKMSSRPVSQRSNGGIDCVASSWITRRQRVDVVGLEGLDVAREQLAVGLVERRRGRCGADVAGLERRARPLQRAVDRGDARLEQLGDLGRLPAQHLAQDQHGALARRQVLQRGDEREPDRLAPDGDVGRVASSATSPSGIGWIHVVSGSMLRFSIDRLLRRAEIHRPGAPLAAAEHVEADVRRDPVQPRAQRGAALEAVVAAPGADERLLHRVLGLERRAEHAVAVGRQLGAVCLEAALELAGGGPRGGRRFLHGAHAIGSPRLRKARRLLAPAHALSPRSQSRSRAAS